MKRILCVLLALLMLCSLAACAEKTPAGSEPGVTEQNEKTLDVVATVFPIYDWTRELTAGAQNVNMTLLLDTGVDLHSFQPTMDDILKISGCDVFIYVGGESDKWVDDALKQARNKDMVALDLMEILGENVKEEEFIEGMQKPEEEEEEEEDGVEYDEHIWLSLKNASLLCDKIAEALAGADAENAALYRKNADAYIEKLNALDAEYAAAVAAAPNKTMVFGDRFPFRYLTADYGITYYAAFLGCSAESEASFETIGFLSKKLSELGLTHIVALESSDGKLAKTIVQNSDTPDAEIVTMDSLQSATLDDAAAGTTYLSVMEKDLEALKTALS